MKFSPKLSRTVCEEIRGEDKQCFRNAILGAAQLGFEATVVEGYIYSEDLPIVIHHGWIEYRDQIVDPTPIFCKRGRAKTFYFPALRWPCKEALKRAMKETLPFSFSDRSTFAALREASVEAHTACYGPEAAELFNRAMQTQEAAVESLG